MSKSDKSNGMAHWLSDPDNNVSIAPEANVGVVAVGPHAVAVAEYGDVNETRSTVTAGKDGATVNTPDGKMTTLTGHQKANFNSPVYAKGNGVQAHAVLPKEYAPKGPDLSALSKLQETEQNRGQKGLHIGTIQSNNGRVIATDVSNPDGTHYSSVDVTNRIIEGNVHPSGNGQGPGLASGPSGPSPGSGPSSGPSSPPPGPAPTSGRGPQGGSPAPGPGTGPTSPAPSASPSGTASGPSNALTGGSAGGGLWSAIKDKALNMVVSGVEKYGNKVEALTQSETGRPRTPRDDYKDALYAQEAAERGRTTAFLDNGMSSGIQKDMAVIGQAMEQQRIVGGQVISRLGLGQMVSGIAPTEQLEKGGPAPLRSR